MGFTATPFVASEAVSAHLPVGVGTGGLAVVAALVVVLGAFYLSRAKESNPQVRSTVVAVAIPLSLTFASIIVFDGFASV